MALGSASRVELSMNQKSLLNSEVKNMKDFHSEKHFLLPLNKHFPELLNHSCSLFQSCFWWCLGNCMCSLLQHQEQEQNCSFTERKEPSVVRNSEQRPASLLCSSAGKRGNMVLLPCSRCPPLGLLGRRWQKEWHFADETTTLRVRNYPSVLVPNCIWQNRCCFLPLKALPQGLQLVALDITSWE